METIGLIAAMEVESAALLRRVKIWRQVKLGPLAASYFDLSGQTCLLVTSGMGARRAEAAARLLIEQAQPRALIAFGIAGAVEPDLRIGDVVLAESACRWDGSTSGPLVPLSALPDPARQAVEQALTPRGARLWAGTAVTTGGAQAAAHQLAHLPNPVLEMETAAIAEAIAQATASAAGQAPPLYAMRAISDNPRAPIPFDLGQMVDEDANLIPSRLLKATIRQPGKLLQLPRLMRNSRRAAENAAAAVDAALSEPFIADYALAARA